MRLAAAELLLDYVFIRAYGLKRGEISYRYNALGKPLLHPGLPHFNVSHSGDWMVAAFGYAPVGIDVERVDEKLNGLVPLMLTGRERREWSFTPGREEYVCSRWVLKESFVKALGVGLQYPLTGVDPYQIGGGCWKHVHCGKAYDLKLIDFDSAYRLSVCSASPKLPERTKLIPLRDCINFGIQNSAVSMRKRRTAREVKASSIVYITLNRSTQD